MQQKGSLPEGNNCAGCDSKVPINEVLTDGAFNSHPVHLIPLGRKPGWEHSITPRIRIHPTQLLSHGCEPYILTSYLVITPREVSCIVTLY